MGLIRGAILIFAGVLLFLMFVVGNTFLVLTSSLEYNNIHSELTSTAKGFLEKEIGIENKIIEQKDIMEKYCKSNSEYVFIQQGYVISLPCTTIKLSDDKILDEGINLLIKEIYYKDYNCDFFIECSKTQFPFFLVSEQAKDYWKEKFFIVLGISLLLITSMFIFAEKRFDLPIKIGSLLIISSLPFLKLESVIGFFNIQFIQFISILFSKSQDVFWEVFIFGVSILILGIIIKLFKIGFKLNEWFSKKEETGKKVSEKENKIVVEEKIEKKSEKVKPKDVKKKSIKPIQDLIDNVKGKKK